MAKLHDADTIRAKELYSELTLKEKVSHFWEYNRRIVFVIVFLLLLAVVVYVLRPVSGSEANLRIKFINAYMEGLTEANNYIEADYETYLGAENTCQMAFSFCEISQEDEMRADVNMERVMSEVAKWSVELFVFDEYAMNKVCPTGFIRDLTTCLDKETLEQLQDRLIYFNDLEGNVVPMAIDIADTGYVKAAGIQGDGVYISFAANLANEEMALQFVAYILSGEK